MLQNITSRELQLIELNVLKAVDEFCRMHDIHYSLYYGTLLGAIRHEGFIPWDDDIDIAMPRPDYERFISTFKNDLYVVKSIESDSKWPFPFAKCMDLRLIVEEHLRGCKPFGAYVDIFPIDGLPNDSDQIKLIYKKIANRWKRIQLGYKPVRKQGEINPFKIIGRFCVTNYLRLNRKKYLEQMLTDSQKFSYETSDYVGVQTIGTYKDKNCLEKKKLGNFTDIQFEGYRFCIFEGFDYVLKHLYGDYMKLPPEDKRVTHLHELKWNK